MANPNPRHDAHAYIRRVCEQIGTKTFKIKERNGEDNQVIAFAVDQNDKPLRYTTIIDSKPYLLAIEQPFRCLGREASSKAS